MYFFKQSKDNPLTSVIFIEAHSRAASTSSKLENMSDPLPSIQWWISFISISDCSSLRLLFMMISAMRKFLWVWKYGHQCGKGIWMEGPEGCVEVWWEEPCPLEWWILGTLWVLGWYAVWILLIITSWAIWAGGGAEGWEARKSGQGPSNRYGNVLLSPPSPVAPWI